MSVNGRFVHYDLMTSDTAAAQAFYGGVIGWTIKPFDGPMEYAMWSLPSGESFGGLMALSDEAKAMGAPPHWIAYVDVADIDGTAAKIVELGGTLLVPVTVIEGDMGRFAIAQDPQGATFAVYTSDRDNGDWEPPNDDLCFSWGEHYSADWAASRAFYTALFGWRETGSMDMGPGGTYWMYGVDEGKSMGGMCNLPPGMGAPPHWLHYVTVPDLDAALERVKANGGVVRNGPMDIPGGDRVAQCADPQGAGFALYEEGAAKA